MARALDEREEEWLALARRIARPGGSRVAAVRAALAEYAGDTLDAREAWEALVSRGLASEQWATRGALDVSREGAVASSDAIESIVAVAGDPEGVAAVEALVAELVRRLEPWNEVRPQRVRWKTVPVSAAKFPTPDAFAASPAFAAIESLYDSATWGPKEDGALHRSVERAFRPVSGRPSGTVSEAKPALRGGDPPWCARFWDRAGPGQHAIYHVTNRALWEAAASRDLLVHRSGTLRKKHFRDLEDPAQVLLEVWRLGYVVGEVTDESVLVYAPERWDSPAL